MSLIIQKLKNVIVPCWHILLYASLTIVRETYCDRLSADVVVCLVFRHRSWIVAKWCSVGLYTLL